MTIILMVFYGVFLVITVLSVTATLIGFFKRWNKARYILNPSFCILGILTMIGFLCCAVLALISIVLMEVCDQTDAIFSVNTPNIIIYWDLKYKTNFFSILGFKLLIIIRYRLRHGFIYYNLQRILWRRWWYSN